MRSFAKIGKKENPDFVKCFFACTCYAFLMTGCIETDEKLVDMDLSAEHQLVEDGDPSPESDVFDQEMLSWEAASEAFEPDSLYCTCSSESVDGDCEYIFWAAVTVCEPADDAVTTSDVWFYPDHQHWVNDDQQEHELYCSMPSIYPYHLGAHHLTLEQIAMYGRDFNNEQTLTGTVYGENVFDRSDEGDREGTLSLINDDPYVQVDYLDVVWNVGNPWIEVWVRVPEVDSGDRSYLSGFRLCYDHVDYP